MTSTPLAARCSHPGCLYMVADDGASTPEVEGLCALHRQRERNRQGVCPNCGGAFDREPEVNTITGQPRRDPHTRQPRVRETCTGCGYTRRAR